MRPGWGDSGGGGLHAPTRLGLWPIHTPHRGEGEISRKLRKSMVNAAVIDLNDLLTAAARALLCRR
jgi:hypothetical protein